MTGSLAKVRIFQGLSRRELDSVARVGRKMQATVGQVMCEQGQPGHEFFVILEGGASVERGGRTIARLSAGDYFGELALLDRGPRSATVRAETDSQLLVIEELDFSALLDEIPGLAHKLLATLATRPPHHWIAGLLEPDLVTVARQKLGARAEELAARRLAAAGWRIVERNARTRFGELDIVALDGRTLVFVEVKAGRAGSAFGPERPVHSVDHRKQRRIRRLATAWMGERRDLPRYAEIRFDAVGATYDRAGRVADYEHIRGAF